MNPICLLVFDSDTTISCYALEVRSNGAVDRARLLSRRYTIIIVIVRKYIMFATVYRRPSICLSNSRRLHAIPA